MSQRLDIAKMEAAFKRAAYKALHGTREERSGRFLPTQKTSPARASDRAASNGAPLAKRKA